MTSFQPEARIRCTCGYDLLRSAGTPEDAAACLVCTWQAGGIYAEHAGVHHWRDTGHRWYLRT